MLSRKITTYINKVLRTYKDLTGFTRTILTDFKEYVKTNKEDITSSKVTDILRDIIMNAGNQSVDMEELVIVYTLVGIVYDYERSLINECMKKL